MRLAGMTKNASLREWKAAVHETLGIDLTEDYYRGEFYSDAIQRWIAQNTAKIKDSDSKTLDSVRTAILNGYMNGRPIKEITASIQDECKFSEKRAALIAKDQISSLNAEITKLQQQDAGVRRYKWSSSRDSRVRDCHRELNGKIFSWDEPPEMWYQTKKYGRVMTGRRCHPGEDYCCRCVAIPVFDIETLDIPVQQIQPIQGENK